MQAEKNASWWNTAKQSCLPKTEVIAPFGEDDQRLGQRGTGMGARGQRGQWWGVGEREEIKAGAASVSQRHKWLTCHRQGTREKRPLDQATRTSLMTSAGVRRPE